MGLDTNLQLGVEFKGKIDSTFTNAMRELQTWSKTVNKGFVEMTKSAARSVTMLDNANKRLDATLKKTGKAFDMTTQKGGRMGKQIGSITGGMNRLTAAMKVTATYGASAFFMMGITRGLREGVKAIAEYDQALKNLQAITGVTTGEVEVMGVVLKEVASTTKFSTAEVGDAMVVLGQAGFSAAETIDSIRAVANLATGTLSDMKEVADLLTTSIRAFGLSTVDASRVSDVFAIAVNKSKLDITKLRTAFNYLGPIAKKAGLSLETTAAAAGVLANSGLKASTIGTGMRQVLARLVAPNQKLREAFLDAGADLSKLNLESNDFITVIKELSKVVTSSEQAFRLFGLRGASAVTTLIENVSKIEGLKEQMFGVGAAANMATTQLQGLQVQWKQFIDKLKVLAVEIGEDGVTGSLKDLVKVMRQIVESITLFIKTGVGKFFVQFGTSAIATAIALGTLTIAVNLLGKAFLFLKGSITKANLVLAGIWGASSALLYIMELSREWNTHLDREIALLSKKSDTLSNNIRILEEYKKKVIKTNIGEKEKEAILQRLNIELEKMGESSDIASKGVVGLADALDLIIEKNKELLGVSIRDTLGKRIEKENELYEKQKQLRRWIRRDKRIAESNPERMDYKVILNKHLKEQGELTVELQAEQRKLNKEMDEYVQILLKENDITEEKIKKFDSNKGLFDPIIRAVRDGSKAIEGKERTYKALLKAFERYQKKLLSKEKKLADEYTLLTKDIPKVITAAYEEADYATRISLNKIANQIKTQKASMDKAYRDKIKVAKGNKEELIKIQAELEAQKTAIDVNGILKWKELENNKLLDKKEALRVNIKTIKEFAAKEIEIVRNREKMLAALKGKTEREKGNAPTKREKENKTKELEVLVIQEGIAAEKIIAITQVTNSVIAEQTKDLNTLRKTEAEKTASKIASIEKKLESIRLRTNTNARKKILEGYKNLVKEVSKLYTELSEKKEGEDYTAKQAELTVLLKKKEFEEILKIMEKETKKELKIAEEEMKKKKAILNKNQKNTIKSFEETSDGKIKLEQEFANKIENEYNLLLRMAKGKFGEKSDLYQNFLNTQILMLAKSKVREEKIEADTLKKTKVRYTEIQAFVKKELNKRWDLVDEHYKKGLVSAQDYATAVAAMEAAGLMTHMEALKKTTIATGTFFDQIKFGFLEASMEAKKFGEVMIDISSNFTDRLSSGIADSIVNFGTLADQMQQEQTTRLQEQMDASMNGLEARYQADLEQYAAAGHSKGEIDAYTASRTAQYENDIANMRSQYNQRRRDEEISTSDVIMAQMNNIGQNMLKWIAEILVKKLASMAIEWALAKALNLAGMTVTRTVNSALIADMIALSGVAATAAKFMSIATYGSAALAGSAAYITAMATMTAADGINIGLGGGGGGEELGTGFANSSGALFAEGGQVTSGSGYKDDVPALLMKDEFVMRSKAVRKYGVRLMKALNEGAISIPTRKFGTGGAVSNPISLNTPSSSESVVIHNDFSGANFQDKAQLQQAMAVIATQVVDATAGKAVVKAYNNDEGIRQIIRSRY